MEAAVLVVLGAALSYGGSLLGQRREARTERNRWLRDKEFETLTQVLGLAARAGTVPRFDLQDEHGNIGPHPTERVKASRDELEAIIREGHALLPAVVILVERGPTQKATDEVLEATLQVVGQAGITAAEHERLQERKVAAELELTFMLRKRYTGA